MEALGKARFAGRAMVSKAGEGYFFARADLEALRPAREEAGVGRAKFVRRVVGWRGARAGELGEGEVR